MAKNELRPDSNELPPNSILNNVRYDNKLKPPPHLLRIFNNYLEAEQVNPSMANEIDFDEFGSKWLALFNYGAHKDQSQIPIMDWVEQVSGSPYRSVKLMRWINGQYVQVALIPPIFGDSAKVIKNDDRDYFGQLAARQAHQIQGAHRIKEANAFIERNFTKRIDTGAKTLTENFYAMSAIFELYGVKRVVPDWIKAFEEEGVESETEDEPKQVQSPHISAMIEED